MSYGVGMDSDVMNPPRGTDIILRRRGKGRKPTASVVGTNPLHLQPFPRWITSPKASVTAVLQGALSPSTEAAFAAGAASFALDQVLRADPPWLGCLSMRQALKAAAVAAKLLRLNADEANLRDAEHLTRPGDDPGPAGRLHRLLRQLALRPVRLASETLSVIATEIEGAAASAEVLALLLADIALAARLGWERPLLLHLTAILDPALRHGEAGKRPRADSADWARQQHAVLARAGIAAHGQAVDLARRAIALTVAASTLRTRDGGRGVGLILTDDSVAPWRMARAGAAAKSGPGQSGQETSGQETANQSKEGLGSDRAARRLCESLHALGVLRLLTDRPTFRLYGM